MEQLIYFIVIFMFYITTVIVSFVRFCGISTLIEAAGLIVAIFGLGLAFRAYNTWKKVQMHTLLVDTIKSYADLVISFEDLNSAHDIKSAKNALSKIEQANDRLSRFNIDLGLLLKSKAKFDKDSHDLLSLLNRLCTDTHIGIEKIKIELAKYEKLNFTAFSGIYLSLLSEFYSYAGKSVTPFIEKKYLSNVEDFLPNSRMTDSVNKKEPHSM